ncbi:efflux transporter outer membrane subunit [Undibacterium oligocarboniphilum]|uniref:Efflux transporter outer membrane subunit n=1 Tax=Undibacterium oligocarboniphilum TaxID=666702 RepID=A0A850QCY7_9BURK|nr:efflux transporter outer membrane subunit [Undibacterium oligocarboniphilum]MBC3869139.1 efflux transporter outer membrane subunit [Undibacterium oligocarboniphilum]NVO77119.1 efflux transporter outer membrane subunit [Undibacterium oligocarboniphilum]
MLRTSFICSAMTASLILAGCASVGPDYQRPALQLPASVGTVVTNHKTTATDYVSWWQGFQDPVLNQLLDEATTNNQDLLLASGRIEEARALATSARSNRFPSVDATLGGTKARTSQNSGKLPVGAALINTDYQLGLSASYEVDLWGKLSRADEAARARLLAQENNRAVVLSGLYSNLAQTYFTLRAGDAQLALVQATLKTRQENLRLQQKRFTAGAIGELDLHQAESEAAAAEISMAQAQQLVAITESAMAVLLGRTPDAIAHPNILRGNTIGNLYQNLSMPNDLPSDLLNRRPDLLAAEQALIAANADIGQAKSQYFPSLKLTIGAGYESKAFHDLINPASWLWNIGANLVQPVFRAGAIGAVVSGAEARKTQAMAQYVQAVQSAFRDVHDALSSAASNESQYVANQKRVVALKDSLRLTDLRYRNGYSSYLEVLNTQRDLAQAETALIDMQRAHLSAVVGLYKAVGGGWSRIESGG